MFLSKKGFIGRLYRANVWKIKICNLANIHFSGHEPDGLDGTTWMDANFYLFIVSHVSLDKIFYDSIPDLGQVA